MRRIGNFVDGISNGFCYRSYGFGSPFGVELGIFVNCRSKGFRFSANGFSSFLRDFFGCYLVGARIAYHDNSPLLKILVA